jgi:hypothetical protein
VADSLFTSQTPAVSDATDGVAYSLGTKFYATVSGSITHGRWYFPGTAPSGSVDFVLYDATSQTQLARATFASGSAGWRTVALSPAVTYSTPNVVLVAVVETPNRYVATVNFFSSGNLISGVLVAPDDGSNGRLSSGATFPTGSFSDSCYFVDVVFVAGGGQSAAASTATETDTAPAVGRQKRRTANLPTESDSAITLARAKRRTAGLPVETDLALALGRRHARVLGVATETNSTVALARRKRRTVGIAGEIDQAVPLVVPDVGVGPGPRYTTATAYGRYSTSTSSRYTTTTQRGRA